MIIELSWRRVLCNLKNFQVQVPTTWKKCRFWTCWFFRVSSIIDDTIVNTFFMLLLNVRNFFSALEFMKKNDRKIAYWWEHGLESRPVSIALVLICSEGAVKLYCSSVFTRFFSKCLLLIPWYENCRKNLWKYKGTII